METTEAQQMRGVSYLCVGLALVVLVGGVAVPGAAQTDEKPTLSVTDAETVIGQPATVDVVLSPLPNGLSGFKQLTVEVQGGSAIIVNATTNQAFEIRNSSVAPDRSRAVFNASDLFDQVKPSADRARLATLTVAGADPGESILSIRVDSLTDDNGTSITPVVNPGAVTLTTPDGAGPGDGQPGESGPGGSGPGESGPGGSGPGEQGPGGDDDPAVGETPGDADGSGGLVSAALPVVAGLALLVFLAIGVRDLFR